MRLSDFLDQKQLTNAAFGARIGVSRQTVLRYRRGDRIPGKAEMALISEATAGAVTANDFYGVTPPPDAVPCPAAGEPQEA